MLEDPLNPLALILTLLCPVESNPISYDQDWTGSDTDYTLPDRP